MPAVQTSAPPHLMVRTAAETVYHAWLPHIGETEALREAAAFASRFHFLIDGPRAPLAGDRTRRHSRQRRRNGLAMISDLRFSADPDRAAPPDMI